MKAFLFLGQFLPRPEQVFYLSHDQDADDEDATEVGRLMNALITPRFKVLNQVSLIGRFPIVDQLHHFVPSFSQSHLQSRQATTKSHL